MKSMVFLVLVLSGVLADENDDLLKTAPLSVKPFGRNDYYYDPPRTVAPGKSLSQIPASRREYACSFDKVRYYEHGDIFIYDYQSRCITYRCEYGAYQIFQEGCLDFATGRCVPVGYSWTTTCHTFHCTKQEINGVLHYEGLRSSISCYDATTGLCRRPGEYFAHTDENGFLRQRCTCRISEGHQKFECYDNNMRVTYTQVL